MVGRYQSEDTSAPIDNSIRALWSAVIVQAITDLELRENKKTKANNTYLREAALRWVTSNKKGGGSMFWICEQLDLDYRRLQMLALTREGRKKIFMSQKEKEKMQRRTK